MPNKVILPKKNPIIFNYKLNNNTITRVEKIKDLGVVFDRKLDFTDHIEYITSKARSLLGFIYRCAKEFIDPYTLKTIYCSFVRSNLEYASVVWSPQYDTHIQSIESVQKHFIKLALRSLSWNRDTFVLPPYENRCKLINLQTLAIRRDNASNVFLADILRGDISSPILLRNINLYAPARTFRNVDLFRGMHHRTNYGMNAPLERGIRLLNRCSCFDFQLNRSQYKNIIKNHSCHSPT